MDRLKPFCSSSPPSLPLDRYQGRSASLIGGSWKRHELLTCLIPLFLGVFIPPQGVRSQEIPPEWAAALDWDVGDWDGPLSFTQITDLMLSPSGRLYATQPDYSEVWAFDLEGNRLNIIGRRGEGPGEFHSPHSLSWMDGSLAVWDSRLFRVSLFEDDETFVRSFPAGLFSREMGILADGSQIGLSEPFVPARDIVSGRVSTLPLKRVNSNTQTTDTLAVFSLAHWQMEVHTGTGVLYTTQPFSDLPLWEVRADGRMMVLVERAVEDLPHRPTFSVTVFDSTASVVAREGVPFNPVPLRRSVVNETAKRQSDRISAQKEALGYPPPPGTNTAEQFRDAYYIPEFQIPVEAVALSTDGSIWLRRESREGQSEVEWEILTEAVEPLASIRLPRDLEIILPTEDWIFATRRDEMDVVHLLRFSLQR